jgi:hypothetical protein
MQAFYQVVISTYTRIKTFLWGKNHNMISIENFFMLVLNVIGDHRFPLGHG